MENNEKNMRKIIAYPWEFQDPKMEAVPYFGNILLGYSLTYRPYIYGRYLQFRFLKWPLSIGKYRKIMDIHWVIIEFNGKT